MASPKNPTQKWIMLVVVIVLLGGLIAFMMSERSSKIEQTTQQPNTTEISTNTQATVSPDEASASVSETASIQEPVTTPTAPTQDATVTPTTQKSAYKDGTYSAMGNYVSPGGAESVEVTLVLKEDVVSDVTVVSKANNPASKNWQARFISGVKAEVVGKKIDTLSLSVVSGSSLTPVGFMDALAKIKVQAES